MNVLQLLRAWEQWEADIIADNKAWPDNQMTINGTHYEKMLELQIKRNEAIKHVAVPIVPVVKQDDWEAKWNKLYEDFKKLDEYNVNLREENKRYKREIDYLHQHLTTKREEGTEATQPH